MMKRVLFICTYTRHTCTLMHMPTHVCTHSFTHTDGWWSSSSSFFKATSPLDWPTLMPLLLGTPDLHSGDVIWPSHLPGKAGDFGCVTQMPQYCSASQPCLSPIYPASQSPPETNRHDFCFLGWIPTAGAMAQESARNACGFHP